MIRSGLSKAIVGRTTALTGQRRSVQMVPRYGSEEAMKADAVQQIRSRVEYQKSLLQAKGHSHAEEVAEMWRWVNITFMVGIPIVFASAFYSMFFDEHPHRHSGELPEYMHIRNKEFPWECSDCDIFDGACWKKCRAEGA